MRQLLADISVVELAEGVAGGYCAKLLADLGAPVLKVERPGGDPLRRPDAVSAPTESSRRGGRWLHLNTNKRSCVVDPDRPGAAERLWGLFERADLVIESPGPGSLAGWGLRWEEVHERLPGLSVVHISGFGASGPYAGYKWDDLVAQAVSGTMLLQDRADQDPLKLPGHMSQCFVGHMAALGAVAAAAVAAAGGGGAFVDCAAMEALATMPSKATTLLSHQYRGGLIRPTVDTTSAMTLIPMGIFPCGDGHVAMMSTPQQLREMLDVLDSDELRAAFARPDAYERGETKEVVDAALYPWLLSRTRAEATAAAQAAGWPLAGVNSPYEVLAADHLHQRSFWVHADDPVAGAVDLPGPPARYAEGGWALRRLAPRLGQLDGNGADGGWEPGRGPAATAPEPAPDGGGRPPLTGVRVLDMTTVWAGPYATMLLADLGAEVIRVENPWVLPPTTKGYQARPAISNLGALGSGYGPLAPGRPDRPYNRHSMNNSLSRNKLSCTIDTRQPDGRELLMRLAERCDVFIENFKASGLSRMGIQVSELQARNPRLIIVRMPPTGTTGDWSSYAGFGAQFDGLSGLTWLCGHRGTDAVTSPSTTYMDAASGPAAAFATVAALHYRAVTGRGQLVELAQMENVIQHLGDVFVDCQLGVKPERMGNRDRWRAPQGLYRGLGENRWLAISVADDDEWQALARAIGRADLADDPRFADTASRQASHDEIDEIISAWTASRDVVAAFHVLQAAGVTAGPLLDDEMFSLDPHVEARGFLRPLTGLDVGTHPHPGQPYRGVPQVWWRASPTLGQDNDYVFQQLLGVSDDDYARYRAAQVIAEDYLDPSGVPY